MAHESPSHDRRSFIKAAGAASALGLSAGCLGLGGGGGGGGDGGDGGMPTISAVRLSNGMTSLIMPVIKEQNYDRKHGFILDSYVRAGIGAYYSDFAAGTYKSIPMGVGTAASMYNRGIDLKIIGGFSLPSVYFLAPPGKSLDSLDDLKGKKIGAPIGAGAYVLANGLAKLKTGSTIKQLSSSLVNAPGPVNPILELARGNVDYAVSWEPAISVTKAQQDLDITREIGVRKGYKDDSALGRDAYYLVWGVRQSLYDKHKDAMSGLMKADQDVKNLIQSDLDKAVKIMTTRTPNPKAPIKKAIKTNRLVYSFPMVNEIKGVLKKEMQLFSDIGIIEKTPGEDIYGDL